MASRKPPSVLSSDDRQRLEAMLRNPQVFAGTPQDIVEDTLRRATEVLAQSTANEQTLRASAEQREKAIRQALGGVASATDAQVDLKRQEAQGLIQRLIEQIEAAVGHPPKP